MDMERKHRSKHPIRNRLIIILLLLVLGAAITFVEHNNFAPEYESLKSQISEVSATAAKITGVQEQTQDYKEILASSGKTYGNLVLDKDEYVSYLGEITLANNLNINKMTVNDIVEAENNMNAMTVRLELQGDLYNVKNFIQQLYETDSVNRIVSFSYRLQSERDLLWMWRGIDDELLVSWWDLTGNDAERTVVPDEEEDVLDAEELLAHGIALCYLEIEFLGVGG